MLYVCLYGVQLGLTALKSKSKLEFILKSSRGRDEVQISQIYSDLKQNIMRIKFENEKNNIEKLKTKTRVCSRRNFV